MVKFIVEGLKWFDRVNGNTYHAVNITDTKTNKLIYSSGLSYGYGDQWQETAITGLIELGLWSKEDRFNHEKKANEIYFNCDENALKRDLKKLEVA